MLVPSTSTKHKLYTKKKRRFRKIFLFFDSKPTKAKRRKKNKKGDEDDPDNPLPEVSKELFSEVTTDLKSAFSQEGPASFSFFSNVDEDSKEDKQNDQGKISLMFDVDYIEQWRSASIQ